MMNHAGGALPPRLSSCLLVWDWLSHCYCKHLWNEQQMQNLSLFLPVIILIIIIIIIERSLFAKGSGEWGKKRDRKAPSKKKSGVECLSKGEREISSFYFLNKLIKLTQIRKKSWGITCPCGGLLFLKIKFIWKTERKLEHSYPQHHFLNS